MKKILFISVIIFFCSLFVQSQTLIEAGCGEYGRYLLKGEDSSVYEDFFKAPNVNLTKVYSGGEKIAHISGALYSAIGLSAAGNAYVFSQGKDTAIRMATDATGKIFTGMIACAGYFGSYITIKSDGTAWYWTSGVDNMLQLKSPSLKPVALVMPSGVKYTRVRMGNVILCLTTTGDLWQYDRGNPIPRKVSLPGPVSDFATSHQGFYIAIVGGDPYVWCIDVAADYVGLPAGKSVPTPVNMKTQWSVSAAIVRITASHNTLHWIDVNHNMFGMGDNAMGEVGVGYELVNRAELYVDPPYRYARPLAWSWERYGQMIRKPVQIGAGIQWANIWQDESYNFYWYAVSTSKVIYFDGRKKSWVAGEDWGGTDIYPNPYDATKPTEIKVWTTPNRSHGNFIPGFVSAGPDRQVLGSSDTLSATGRPGMDHSIVAWSWTQLKGAPTVIVSPMAAKTPVRQLSAGTAVFMVLMTDENGGTIADTVNYSISIPNILPIARASAPDSLILPVDSALLDGSLSSDADGSIAGYSWTQISGLAAILDNPRAAQCLAKQLQPGTYIFQLVVTDNQGASAKTLVTVIVRNRPRIIKTETAWTTSGEVVTVFWDDGTVQVIGQ